MEYFNAGKLVAVFGLQGELILKHNFGKKTSLKGLTTLFIEEKKDRFIPWFIQGTRIKNEEEIFIKLEGVATREQAIKLVQKQAWLPEADFKKFAARSAAAGLLNFDIIQGGETLGKVLEVIEQPHQTLCRIDLQGKEALIPLHEETLLKIDKKKGQIVVDLPEGLLDIYR